ncbi:MAG: hypothetical protein AAF487_02020, partial [Bacteroidota bacterium]
MTLGEALEEFYRDNEVHLSHNSADLSDEVRSFFKSHDIAHVIFGCNISLFGEGAVKIWTIFGTSLGFWNHLSDYKKASAFRLAEQFIWYQELGNALKLFL